MIGVNSFNKVKGRKYYIVLEVIFTASSLKKKTVLTFESVNELETWTAKIIIIAKETIFPPALNTC